MLGQDRFEYRLESPISYHHKGEKRDGELLVLIAPTARQNALRQKMQQMFMQAIASLRGKNSEQQTDEQPTDPSDAKMGASEVLSIIMMSSIDMHEFNEMFKRLLLDGACLVEGEEKLTLKMYEDFSAYDCDKLLGEYMAFFIAALALRLMSSN